MMNKKTTNPIVRRILASMMAFFMVVLTVPFPTGRRVYAATDTHPSCVTITVRDKDGNPIEGAQVDYTIEEDSAAGGGGTFTPISDSGITGDDGVVEVLDSADYVDGLRIEADISKENYKTESVSSSISNNEYDIQVRLIELLDIENVNIEVLEHDYTGENQALVISVTTNPEIDGLTIEYSEDDTNWSRDIPEQMNAGSYSVYVKLSKDGYKTYKSNGQTAKINRIDIPGLDIVAKTGLVYNAGQSQELVAYSGDGAIESGDTVTWTLNGAETGETSIPTASVPGTYTVGLKVERGANYNAFEKVVKDIEISNAALDLAGMSVKGLNGVYTGELQEVVTVENQGDYTLKYQLGDGISSEPDESAWEADIPKVTGPGTYQVWVKAVKTNYDDKPVDVEAAKDAVAPYNVYIAKAEQDFAFDNAAYNAESSSVSININDLVSGHSLDFGATDINALAGGSITYEVNADSDEMASIDASGSLTIKGAGKITVKAILSGNDYYSEKVIQHVLTVIATKSEESDSISFDADTVNYVVGNKAGVPENKANKKHSMDSGSVTYSIESADDMGLIISNEEGNAGSVSVGDYLKLISAIESNKGMITVTVNAAKTEVISAEDVVIYPADSASYTLNITLRDLPENAYSIYDIADMENPLAEENGTDGWYNTVLEIKPASGYTILRGDELTDGEPEFASSVRYGETVEAEVLDQGKNSGRTVYLRHIETGEITKKTVLSIEKLDNIKPYNVDILFPAADETDGIKYYGDAITVTFIAYDTTSGVARFNWEYIKADGASESILTSDSGSVAATVDPEDKTKYTGTLSLPKKEAEQLRGNLKVSATDNAGNTCDSYTDTNVFVVDTIAPTQTVTYELKNGDGTTQTVNERHYFSNDVVFTFKITEGNFFPEDVELYVAKNEGEKQKQILTWTTTENIDEHKALLTLTEEGDYVVSMSYHDRSGKEMTSYDSDTIVVDKTKPIIQFAYMDYTNEASAQTAVITITEHNFRASDVVLDVIAKDITGQTIPVDDFKQYFSNIVWSTEGDIHTAVISDKFVDANYDLTFNYKDLALNAAAEVKPDTFIVDRTAPDASKMSITYSNPVFDTVLSTITFGYYNPTVTMVFTGYDSTAGIDYFTWSYKKESNTSSVNIEEYEEAKVIAVQDSTDKAKFTATINLPKEEAEQLRGNITVASTDKYNNTSNKLTDTNHIIVVDTIAPALTVEYNTADNVVGDKNYYNKSLTATFTVTEANFYEEDVKVKLMKDDEEAEDIALKWIDSVTEDVHIGTYTIDANSDHSNDADYVFLVTYIDRSNNEMTSYTSDTKIIDTTIPVISVVYSNNSPMSIKTDSEGHRRKYFSSTNTATITIKEHNFEPSEVQYTLSAKDVAGNTLNAGALHSRSAWSTNGDDHVMTITYPGDANYSFDMAYTDLAKLDAEDYAGDYFTIDKTRPTDLTVKYSQSILETILTAVTFGFYQGKATVTMSATDNTSGINFMKYSYVVADGVSNVNASLIEEVVNDSAIQMSNGGATGTVVFEIPRNALEANNQFNGTVNFTATDLANNESDYLRDTKRIIVDNIAPTANVEYNAPVQQVNGISYYDGDINATVTINEANFYEEDVIITAVKNGVENPINANWTLNGTDVHIGAFTLSGDGDYSIRINYSDKSSNTMQEYRSEQMTIDTVIEEPTITINGANADGKAFKDDVVLAVSFEDRNYETYKLQLVRTSYADKNVNVTEKFIADGITTSATGGSGTFDTFEKNAENDGIYTATVEMCDKAGHVIQKSAKFTVNRYGSVYEFSDYLVSMIADGGAYVQKVDKDFVITEYNADRLVRDSLDIEISRDGRPLDDSKYTVTPDINGVVETGDSGWFQYTYTISRENFASDGVYKIAVSSRDNTGNRPENSNYDDKNILFRVDSTKPEITSIIGLEESVINATEQTVKYSVYDTIGLASVVVYVDGSEVNSTTDFSEDANNYSETFKLKEKSSSQRVRLVVTDKAGNVTDTNASDFESSYVFNSVVTVSTNAFVRWYADKPLFYGSIAGTTAVTGGGIGTAVFFRKRKLLKLLLKAGK